VKGEKSSVNCLRTEYGKPTNVPFALLLCILLRSFLHAEDILLLLVLERSNHTMKVQTVSESPGSSELF
jgi:hypothetical protein